MAFKFYGGAGVDNPQQVAQPQPVAPPARPLPVMPPGMQAGYQAWLAEVQEPGSRLVAEAFAAGAKWQEAWLAAQPQRRDTTPDQAKQGRPEGEYRQYLCMGGYLGDVEQEPPAPVEAPVLQTILAALAFYRDNHLTYGPLPGQLTAEQVTELIAQLSPEEQEPQA